MNMFIVESPGKVKKIQGFLGPSYKVEASVGHIRDLPTNDMGIEFDTWKIKYQLTDKGKGVYKKLKALAEKSERIYLATDSDREGEAIAWHLAVMLKISPERIYRVKYNAITKEAITKALASPERLNINLVRAQEARRALDRLVGYTVSPSLSRAVQNRLSAGRVQSIAVRLITDRFNQNQAFVSKDYYGATLKFDGFSADWNTKPFHKPGENYNFDRNLAVQASKTPTVKVTSIESKNTTKKPPAPFTTSTMQQAAVKKLGIDIEVVMEFAQKLYEAAAITYHRTDSVELAPEAIEQIRDYAQSKGLPLPDKPNTFSAKSKNAQEAHEAIRPTNIEIENISGVSEGASKLYQLIHQQALICQLKPAKLKKTTVVLNSEDEQFEFVAKGSIVLDKGFMVLAGSGDDQLLPELTEDKLINVNEGLVKDQKTKAPALFDQVSLLAELERLGIGRPSTWGPIIKSIKTRGYVAIEKKKFVPTETGQILRKALDGFGFMEYSFTADIEEQMDAISNGQDNYQAVVGRVFNTVLNDLRNHFGYSGDGSDFFLPSEARDYKPSEKQLDYANKIADSLGLDISSVNLESGREVSAFMEKHAKAYKLNFKPTEKQILFAEGIAEKVGIDLPDDIKNSAVKLSAWIEKNKQAAMNASMASKPPTDKQIALAEKLATDSGNALPEGYATNMLVCSQFIDQVMGSKPRKKKRVAKKA